VLLQGFDGNLYIKAHVEASVVNTSTPQRLLDRAAYSGRIRMVRDAKADDPGGAPGENGGR
jgi:hypothetical protein